jgi:hypothetical protein
MNKEALLKKLKNNEHIKNINQDIYIELKNTYTDLLIVIKDRINSSSINVIATDKKGIPSKLYKEKLPEAKKLILKLEYILDLKAEIYIEDDDEYCEYEYIATFASFGF